jgi:uncharacterized protein YidB (DUF937 family)
MGLFDSLVGEVMNNLGGGQTGGNSMLEMVTGLLQQQGGLAALVQQLGKGGLGEQVASWVGSGANLPVNPAQISQALGSGPLDELAAKFGLDPEQISGSLAQFLPEAVNQLTPEGRLPETEGDLMSQGLSALAGKLFG